MKTASYVDVLLLGLAATCTHAQDTATTEPCAQVAQVFGAATSKPIRVDADIALACLQSVPLHVTEGMMQLEGLKSLLEFQSNLAYLKDPPPGWYYPAVDMLGEIDSMASRLQENRYASEYDFQLDIYKLVASARDAHLVYTPDIIDVFSFQRAGSIISVSNDGLDVPSLYLYREVVAVVKNGSTMATSIVSINGENAEQWLERYAEVNGQYHDPDVDYNAVFPNSVTNGYGAASGGGASAGVFTGSSFHQGNATTLTFENGTTIEVPTYAVVQANFTGVTDGASFYDKFCTGSQESSTGSSAPSDASESATPTYTQAPFSAVPTQANLPTISGFPDALVMASDYSVAGYLTADGFAVLSIPSFNVDDDAVPDFQSTVRKLLATAQVHGSTHLIIDVRGNGGGSTFLAFDVFKQIFPKQTPTATLNSRAHPLFNDLGTIFSSHFQNTTTADPPQSTVNLESPLNVANNLKDQSTRYPTWSSFYGPIQTHNDTFTNLMQYNLTNPPLASYSITSYGPLSNITTQPVFSPSQILLLSDGVCGSACALFSELLKSQAPEPIKSLVFGGRSHPGPMQAVGNTKGAEVRPFNRLRFYFDDAISELGTPEQSQALLAKYPNFNASTEQVLLRASLSSGNPQLNLRNNIRVGDDEERTPMQFIYEAADCRLFYTAEQIFNQSAVWAAAKEAIWGGGDCVEGSKGEPSAGLLVGKEALVPFGGGEAKEQGSDGASVSTGAADGLLYSGRGMMVGVATAVGAALMLL